jgi:hypothetical protein
LIGAEDKNFEITEALANLYGVLSRAVLKILDR